ncbi:endonuclease/exonuclease/phosphatase family protein [Filimonas effusa]|uniref:Endonuclease/exonuclease/phosphatase n=1 Tax=Filimonas effusa TaxID=2508721 RepID=A0A4Q1D0Z6_9BACT|nr:endonuclease/exonuclease/phosphatase [Filimonas effusa]RXK80596.1 endonuclease/exonuclease/phosphatase [Filimonas effusa]
MYYTFELLLLLPFLFLLKTADTQQQVYQPVVIGFYNCENLYDTLDDPNIYDEEFLPGGVRRYNSSRYDHKISQLARVIAVMGTTVNKDGAALLGVAEIENYNVLRDLVRHPLLSSRHYQIVHYDSKDARGVDVGLLYQPQYFTPDSSKALPVSLPIDNYLSPKGEVHRTRDILWVSGLLNGERVDCYVNHWPSRLGGERYSFPSRAAAANVCRRHSDSVMTARPGSKLIVMGDFNDDPVSRSITRVLGAAGDRSKVAPGQLYNPWQQLYRKGTGTLAYQDTWSLFDQILISYPFLLKPQTGYFFYKAVVLREPWMQEPAGRYKGYPMRSWDRYSYRGGFSDHFPVYIVLLKAAGQIRAIQ